MFQIPDMSFTLTNRENHYEKYNSNKVTFV